MNIASTIVFVVIAVLLGVMSNARNLTWNDAVSLWKDAATKSPAKSRAQYNLGVAYKDAGDMPLAARALLEAVRLDPNSPEGRNNLGNVYFISGLLDEAAAQYKVSVALFAENAEAHYNLALIYRIQGRYTEAAAHFGRFADIAGPEYRLEAAQARRFVKEYGARD
ncbi:MAG: tetratricopeptide repeat protein [Deltaproteobacteria bacterium]|nr:tetratricopeptide repeat protein [Deltaproteobacteria bacterium]